MIKYQYRNTVDMTKATQMIYLNTYIIIDS